MKYKILTLIIVAFSALASGQEVKKTFYPGKVLKSIEVYRGHKVVEASQYSEKGELRYRWNLRSKTIESFTYIMPEDTLAQKFFDTCPTYRIVQHAGAKGPTISIENYNNQRLDGPFTKYDTLGGVLQQGNFRKGKKFGVWKYRDSDGNYENRLMVAGNTYGDGISVQKSIIPFLITIMMLALAGYMISRKFSYKIFYHAANYSFYGIIFTLFFLGGFISKNVEIETLYRVQDYTPSIIFALLSAVLGLSVTNVFLGVRTGVGRKTSIIYLIAGILTALLIFYIVLMSAISGSVY